MREFTRKIVSDIGETICPIILITRRPDGTGLYNIYKGLIGSLEGSVPTFTLFLGENATIENIRKIAWQYGASSIIFCEAFYQFINPNELKTLKSEVKIKTALIFPWDSSELDQRDVNCIEECIDILLPICEEYANSWKSNFSKNIQIGYFQIPLSLGAYETLAFNRGNKTVDDQVNLLTIASFHPRKNHDIAIDAVQKLLDSGSNVKLRIHSNLNQGEFTVIKQLAKEKLGENCLVTNHELSTDELLDLFRTSDIYLSCSQGEGCNIGLRSALSSGMPIVFTDIPGHRDLLKYKLGVFPVQAPNSVPGIYPERSNAAFGTQFKSDATLISNALTNAINYLHSKECNSIEIAQQNSQQDERRSKLYMWNLLASFGLLTTHQKLSRRRSGALKNPQDVLVVPSLDAGFFSIVNTYLSHKFFWEHPSLYDQVVAEWSPDMVSFAQNKPSEKFTSYCYSTPSDGNGFAKLFNRGRSVYFELAKDSEYTFAGTSANAWVDPNLTYIHSEKLYKSAIFKNWRKHMSRVFWENIHLPDEILIEIAQISSIRENFEMTLAMHVRHPSHAMEQRDRSIALVDDYIAVAEDWMNQKSNPSNCAIILATDQQSVVDEFNKKFPKNLICRQNVARVSKEDTDNEEFLADADKLKEGRQIQHLMASHQEKWNLKNAIDVTADALVLSLADALVHVNSNVATIVSIMNPNIEMLHIKGGDNFDSLVSRSMLHKFFPTF